MEEKLFLGLKTGAAQTEADGQVGLLTCYADNARQAAVLRAQDGPEEEWEIALATAAFILDFGDFYDTGGADPPEEAGASKKQTNHS